MPLSFIFIGSILIFACGLYKQRVPLIIKLCLAFMLLSYFLPSVIIGCIIFSPLKAICATLICLTISKHVCLKHACFSALTILIFIVFTILTINNNIFDNLNFPVFVYILLTITCILLPQNIGITTFILTHYVITIIMAYYHNYNAIMVDMLPEEVMVMGAIIAFVGVALRKIAAALKRRVYKEAKTSR